MLDAEQLVANAGRTHEEPWHVDAVGEGRVEREVAGGP